MKSPEERSREVATAALLSNVSEGIVRAAAAAAIRAAVLEALIEVEREAYAPWETEHRDAIAKMKQRVATSGKEK